MEKINYGLALRALRESNGLTQQQVARILHTSRQTVCAWESDYRTMSQVNYEFLTMKLNGE